MTLKVFTMRLFATRFIPFLLATFIAAAGAAQTQFRTQPRSTFGQPQTTAGQTLNAADEKTKTEAQQAHQAGRHQEAINMVGGLLNRNPRDDVALHIRASARVELGVQRRDAALIRAGVGDARTAISINGRNHVVYYMPYLFGMTQLANVETRPGHAETAASVAGKLLDLKSLANADKANIHFQRALARMRLKQHEKAADDFTSAIRLSPGHIGSHLGLAEAHIAAGEMEDATLAYNEAALAFRTEPVVFNSRGRHLQKLGKSREAIADFNRVLQFDPKQSAALTNRGLARMSLGELEAAEADFNASLALDRSPTAYSLRGTVRLKQGRLEQATGDYINVVRLDPRNPLAHVDLGYARFFAGDFPAALRSFDLALELNPDLEYLLPWRYWAMQQAGRSDELAKTFQASASDDPVQRTWPQRLVRYLAGETTAEHLLGLTVTADGERLAAETCEANYFIGLRMQKDGRTDEAGSHFKAAVNTRQQSLSAYRGAQLALNRIQTAAASN